MWISSLWHSEHWAEITLHQHRWGPSQCFVLIKQSDSPWPYQFWDSCSSLKEQSEDHSFSNHRLRARIRQCPNALRQLPTQKTSFEKDSWDQLSEPFLFPKLRNYFADFPQLPFSIDQRLLTLETWCGYGYERVCELNCTLDFQGILEARRISNKWRDVTNHCSLSPDDMIPRMMAVKKNRELFPEHPRTSPSCCVLPQNPQLGCGMLTPSPFTSSTKMYYKGPPFHLGPTNPRSNAVHVEPFATSVFKILGWIFATTTKICTRQCSTRINIVAS